MTEALINGQKTGRSVRVYGQNLTEVKAECGPHDTVLVDGVAYYVTDLAGFVVGCRRACGVDSGGNLINDWRTAPERLDGVAAHPSGFRRATKVRYSDPEILIV